MNKKQKIIAGLVIGAAAGVAAAFFLQTESGKKTFAKLKDLASDTIDDAMQKLSNLEGKLKDQFVDDAEEA